MGERADDLSPIEDVKGSSDEIECHVRNIEETRADMSQTLDAIQERLQPSHLVSQARAATRERVEETVDRARQKARAVAADVREKALDVRDAAAEAGGRAASFARLNAVPLLLTAAGTFLVIRALRSESESTSSYETYSSLDRSIEQPDLSMADLSGTCDPVESEATIASERRASSPGVLTRLRHRAGGLGHRIIDRAGDVGDQVRSSASHVTGQVREGVGHLGARLQDGAEAMGERLGQAGSELRDRAMYLGGRMQEGATRAGTSLQAFYDDNPLAAGAIFLSLGLGGGLLLPVTSYENRIMGPARDDLLHKAQEGAQDLMARAQEGAHEVVERVQEVAQEAMSEARESISEAPGGEAREKRDDQGIKITIGPGRRAAQQPPVKPIPSAGPPPVPANPPAQRPMERIQPSPRPEGSEARSTAPADVNVAPSKGPEPPRPS